MNPITPARRLSWLTPRERVVLQHLMDGLSAEQIAAVEYVGLATIRTQIRSLMQKLGAHSQLQAVAIAYSQLWPCPDSRRQAVNDMLVTA